MSGRAVTSALVVVGLAVAAGAQQGPTSARPTSIVQLGDSVRQLFSGT